MSGAKLLAAPDLALTWRSGSTIEHVSLEVPTVEKTAWPWTFKF